MSKDEIKNVFHNLTMGVCRWAEWEWDQESTVTTEANSIEIKAQAAQPNTPMHITDWAQAHREDPKLEAVLDWCLNDKKKGTPWAQQLKNFKACLVPLKTNLRVNALSEMLIS